MTQSNPERRTTGRRTVVRFGILGALTLVTGGIAALLRQFGAGTPGGAGGSGTTTGTSAPATPAATGATTASPAAPTPATSAALASPVATPVGAGPVIGNLSDFGPLDAVAFTVPYESPTELMPGAPGIMVKLPDGTVVAYNALCTHGRCTVGWDATTGIIECPCHLARFDPADRAAVVSGPAPTPLLWIPVAVGQDGEIHVTVTR